MILRPYRESDADETLDVFRRAIRTTASRDYNAAQVAAWASDDIDPVRWATRRRTSRTHVAELDERIVGFTDVDDHGYIDMLFVDPDAARQGVASALLAWVVATARDLDVTELTTHASLTARHFFETQGFKVVDERHPVLRGVTLTNFVMCRGVGADGRG